MISAMKLRFSGWTRRPLLMALLLGGGMCFVAINNYQVAPQELVKLGLISLALVLLIAVPAALLVAIVKLVQHLMKKNEERDS